MEASAQVDLRRGTSGWAAFCDVSQGISAGTTHLPWCCAWAANSAFAYSTTLASPKELNDRDKPQEPSFWDYFVFYDSWIEFWFIFSASILKIMGKKGLIYFFVNSKIKSL